MCSSTSTGGRLSPPRTTYTHSNPQPIVLRPLQWPKLTPALCSNGELNETEMRQNHPSIPVSSCRGSLRSSADSIKHWVRGGMCLVHVGRVRFAGLSQRDGQPFTLSFIPIAKLISTCCKLTHRKNTEPTSAQHSCRKTIAFPTVLPGWIKKSFQSQFEFYSWFEYFIPTAPLWTAVKSSQQETCMAYYYYAYSLQPPHFFITASCPPCSSHPHPLLFTSPSLFSLSRSWSYRSTGPTLHRLACADTLQTCWPFWAIATSYVLQHVTWLSTCWTCSWTTMMWLSSSSMSLLSPACC